MAKLRTHKEYIKLIKFKYSGFITVKGEYLNSYTPISHRCKEGHTTLQTPDKMLGQKEHKTGCTICNVMQANKNQTKSKEQHSLDIGDNFELLSSYVNAYTPCEYRCVACKGTFTKKPSVLQINPECPLCLTENQQKRIKSFSSVIAKLNQRLVKVWRVNHTQVESTICCELCDFTWNVKVGTRAVPCPNCGQSFKTIRVTNKDIRLQGFEHFAIETLLIRHKLKELVLAHSGNVPKIKYTFKRKLHTHKPDIWIPKNNSLVEVKSIFTLGLDKTYYGGKNATLVFNKHKAKARAALTQGFKYRVMLFSASGKQLKLPKFWYEMTRSEVRKLLKRE
jgi:hypothetical protein